jgi:hypothetical protein
MQQSRCSWIELLRQVETEKIVAERVCNQIEKCDLTSNLQVGVRIVDLSAR